MTVLAFRDRVFAADSRGTDGCGIYPGIESKLTISHRWPVVYGYCGDAAVATAFIFEFDEQGKFPWRGYKYNLEDYPIIGTDTKVVVADFDGGIHVFEGNGWYPVRANYFAEGSGASFAIAAMELGKTAVEAAELACKLDHRCGTPVKQVHLDDLPVKKWPPKRRSRKEGK